MQGRPEKYQLVLAALTLALALTLNAMLDALFRVLLRALLQSATGNIAAGVIEGVVVIALPFAAALAIVWLLARVMRGENSKALEEFNRPLMVCTYEPGDVRCLQSQLPAVFYETQVGAVMRRQDAADWYRVRVDAPHVVSIPDVTAHLIAIRRDSVTLFDGDMRLTFAEKHGADDRVALLSPGVPRYVDVLAITEHNRIILTARGFVGPGSVPYDILLTRNGTYRFSVMVRGTTTHARLALVIKWTGQRATSTVRASYS